MINKQDRVIVQIFISLKLQLDPFLLLNLTQNCVVRSVNVKKEPLLWRLPALFSHSCMPYVTHIYDSFNVSYKI